MIGKEGTMRQVKYVYQKFLDSSFRTKLMLSYFLLSGFIVLILGFVYFETSAQNITTNVTDSVTSVLRSNNELLDNKLAAIQKTVDMIPIDHELLQTITDVDTSDSSSLLRTDRSITKILYRYFGNMEEVYSSQIMTRNYAYGSTNRMYIPVQPFYSSPLATTAVEAEGATRWIPSYSYADTFHQQDLKQGSYEFSSLFAVVKQLHLTSIDDAGTFHTLPEGKEKPILVLNFRPDLLKGVFEDYAARSGFAHLSYGMIHDQNGLVISSDGPNQEGKPVAGWLKNAITSEQGMKMVSVKGQTILLVYEAMKTTGWVSYIAIPMEDVLGHLSTIRTYTLFFLGFMMLMAVILAYLLSVYISKPITDMKQAMKKMEKGHFDIRIPERGYDELGDLIIRFNQMNGKIQDLIEENYKSRLRAKESELMALNLQLNPHFLYNTLTTMYWIALEHKQQELGQMIINLAEMLQITTRNKNDTWSLETDLKWLEKYIYIMQNRFEDKFTVEYNIDPMLLQMEVPKLFLQPFVENSIIHGFAELESGGQIRITAWIEKQLVCFKVEDNGRGIQEDHIRQIQAGEIRSTGIKNVDRRVRLLYGTEYGVTLHSPEGKGAAVLIRIGKAHTSNQMTPIQ
ncbi:histidine kinase [Paenibacillus peoriae]|nr:histidine kinase [Paenibacillus peoriae]MEC0182151.1 histidine kinase [Paenibacillus peoriae]